MKSRIFLVLITLIFGTVCVVLIKNFIIADFIIAVTMTILIIVILSPFIRGLVSKEDYRMFLCILGFAGLFILFLMGVGILDYP